MRTCRTAIVVPPLAALDERIRVLFPPGAMYACEPEPIDTLVERRMRQMSSDIRSKSDWIDSLNDADARAGWAAESKAKELTDVEFAYVMDELAYYASLHPPDSKIRLSAAGGVWFSDALVDAETTSELRDYAAILESVPDRQKDWHPNDRSRVLNLIDPSLYPLIYSRSRLCRQTSTLPHAILKPEKAGEFPGSLDKWRRAVIMMKSLYWSPAWARNFGHWHRRPLGDLTNTWALNVITDRESNYYLPKMPNMDWQYGSYFSNEFSWLPSEFRVGYNGAVTIESYVNNLHPVKNAALYPIIASVFSKFLPLLEQVVTDLVHPRQPRVKPDPDEYYKNDDPLPHSDDDDYYEEFKRWRRYATFVHPQPEPFVAPTRPVNPYKLSGRRLQAIVKMSNIELTSEKPIYGGKDWSVAGLANERIIATGIFFYDVANIAPSSLLFREAFDAVTFAADRYDMESVVRAYGIESDRLEPGYPVSQELGGVGIRDGLCVVFPNIHQFKVPELELADKTKSGHCKMLTFYFVDPSTRIPSTEIVPPQQQDWWVDDVVLCEPFRSLPQLVMDGIMAKVDFPISLKEAKKTRPQVHQDKNIMNFISGLFEPDAFFGV
ncbi:hypothetical protein GGI03_002866 [Coemansia sp. RSA 2337]|nr:hypothetical protein H4S03_006974 [Coemansia sp. S3946]KAJ2465067.1 hypothetical protein GGI03_002866 [Coemansia sp. RSA 2337]